MNLNIGCIETLLFLSSDFQGKWMNLNIGCIETKEKSARTPHKI